MNLHRRIKQILTEKKGIKYDAGILKFNIPIPNWKMYTDQINIEDLFKPEEKGIEDEPHITFIYGFDDNHNIEDITTLIDDNLKSFEVTGEKITLFENEEFDVVKIQIKVPKWLHTKRTKMAKKLDIELTYPDYSPHMTIAYVNKGEGKKYVKKLEEVLELKVDKISYRGKDGERKTIKLKDE